MSGSPNDEGEKSFDPTPQKLLNAREKGDIARSADLSVAAGYAGLLVALLAVGPASVIGFGSGLIPFLDQPDELSALIFEGGPQPVLGAALWHSATAAFPWFAVPALAVLASILGQRGFVVAPSKLAPRLSRISLVSNAKQKFGRNGMFEFSKSFAKLLLYGLCMALFLRAHLADLMALPGADPATTVTMLGRLGTRFLALAVAIAACIGIVDAFWQHVEHRRKNMMTRKEIQDEHKESEGDPHLKNRRRQRGQKIAQNQMMAEVPTADVVIVNPTHYAVALKWSRSPGSAPACVAKGVDEIARTIRETAIGAGVPVLSDPPTARALHATVGLGEEIPEDHYQAVAAAIRFADDMRLRARGRVV